MAIPLRLAAALALCGCATAGSTWGSGVGETFLEHPPYYAGPGAVVGASMGYLPVVYQRGASQAPIFDPSLGDATLELLARMTELLLELDIGPRLAEGGRVSAVSHQETLASPDVQLGCTVAGGRDDECEEPDGAVVGRIDQRMRLAVGRPAPEWIAWASSLMEANEVDHVLVVTLETGQHWIRQRGLRGTKVVELGTDYTVTLPWLTGLETPVWVVQLTGALVARDGRSVRIGAEGMLARRTGLAAGALGLQALPTDEEMSALLRARREDLPGRPLVWEAALRTLVHELTARPTR